MSTKFSSLQYYVCMLHLHRLISSAPFTLEMFVRLEYNCVSVNVCYVAANSSGWPKCLNTDIKKRVLVLTAFGRKTI